jgi:hypothetical protein
MDGALRANANRAWLLGLSDHSDRARRNRVRRLCAHAAADSDSHRPQRRRLGAGQARKGRCIGSCHGGTDQFLDEAFVKRFLTSYLNYSPSDVDDHWAASLNMMTRNLRGYTLKAMGDDDTRGKIDDGQIQSVFHLREIDAVSGEPLTYLVYGVKDVHHLSNGTEVTDHFVNEYRMRLIADKRSDVNPMGCGLPSTASGPSMASAAIAF